MDREAYLEKRLGQLFDDWYHVKEYGARDNLFWTDGKKLNVIRWHIENCKKELEEIGYMPPILDRNTPPEINEEYMAKEDKITKNAIKALNRYKRDTNYKALIEAKISVWVTGVVGKLEIAIKNNDVRQMKNYSNLDFYIGKFRELARLYGVEKEVEGQLSLF